MKLYELTGSFNQLFELVDTEGFDLNSLEEALQAIEGAVEVKVENIARMIRNWEAQAAAMDAEAKRLANNKRALENRIAHMKDYVLQSMEVLAKDKIPTSIGNICRQKNPPSIDIFDMSLVPETYIVIPPVEPRVDKKSILEHYKSSGEIISGTRIVQGYHLRIR